MKTKPKTKSTAQPASETHPQNTKTPKTHPNSGDADTRPVTFHFDDPQASMVSIAGTFNEWHPSATPMVPLGQGRWAKTLELKPGTYEYLFVVDGRWVPDPGSAVTVTNPFGGINCCVSVR